MDLYIADKNYSTWSLRAYLLMEKSGLKYNEIKLDLATEAFYSTLKSLAPTAKVPFLVDQNIRVWESLAICEYINETYLSGKFWPHAAAHRAKARALANEMHAGFSALRNEMPMNLRAKRKIQLSAAANRDLARIDSIFSEQMAEFANQGGWLFGDWSIADAMYAPVVMRLPTYGITLSETAELYCTQVRSDPVMQKWLADALLETAIVDMDEVGEPVA